MGFGFFGNSDTDESSLLLNVPNKSFKERNNYSERVAAVQGIRDKFPNKIPVIVERFKKVLLDFNIFSSIASVFSGEIITMHRQSEVLGSKRADRGPASNNCKE